MSRRNDAELFDLLLPIVEKIKTLMKNGDAPSLAALLAHHPAALDLAQRALEREAAGEWQLPPGERAALRKALALVALGATAPPPRVDHPPRPPGS